MSGKTTGMIRFLALTVLLLSACSSPALRFGGVEATRMEVGGHTFDVYALADEAQVIRLNRKWRPDAAQVIVAGAEAAERATGCTAVVRSADADAAVMTFPLKC